MCICFFISRWLPISSSEKENDFDMLFFWATVYIYSIYFLQPIERKPKKFNPLVVPKTLQAALPFASKPKDIPSRRKPLLENRRAVVMEPHERKVHALVQHLRLIRHEKVFSFIWS